MVRTVVKSLGRARAAVVLCVTALAVMALPALASAAPIIEGATSEAKSQFNENLPPILALMGLVAAIALVIVFFRKHATKGK